MSILLRVLKKALYSSKTKHNTAIMAVLALIVSPITATTSVALADSKVQTGSAFLTVQPSTIDEKNSGDMALQNDIFFMVNGRAFVSSVSADKSAPVVKIPGRVVIVTAYSSTPDQTDSSPFITANGTYVRDGIIATNFLPFGAKVKFPEYSGDKIFTVADRMAKKNSHKIDIWMASRNAAMNFGVKRLAYEIVE